MKYYSLQKSHHMSAAELGSDPSYPWGGFPGFKDMTKTQQRTEFLLNILVFFGLYL